MQMWEEDISSIVNGRVQHVWKVCVPANTLKYCNAKAVKNSPLWTVGSIKQDLDLGTFSTQIYNVGSTVVTAVPNRVGTEQSTSAAMNAVAAIFKSPASSTHSGEQKMNTPTCKKITKIIIFIMFLNLPTILNSLNHGNRTFHYCLCSKCQRHIRRQSYPFTGR